MPDPIDARLRELGAFIRDQRHLGELSLRALSERTGISNPYLSQIERGLRKPSAEILRELARALRISAETLYVRAGILDETPGGPLPTGVPEAIRHDPVLTDDQKTALLRIYRSFLAERGADGEPPPAPGSAPASTTPAPIRTGASARPARASTTTKGGR